MDSSTPNGAGAVDLSALQAQAIQKAQLDSHREELTVQLLTQAGLQCQCGERIRGVPTLYFGVVDGPVMTAQGPQLGLNLAVVTCCSATCATAVMAEQTAIARRDGPAGRVTWLDERRAARAARDQ